jgi:hypothetical protein
MTARAGVEGGGGVSCDKEGVVVDAAGKVEGEGGGAGCEGRGAGCEGGGRLIGVNDVVIGGGEVPAMVVMVTVMNKYGCCEWRKR